MCDLEAGDGVFLKTHKPNRTIYQGELLGFVPGIIYSSYEIVNHQYIKTEKPFITSFNGTTIDYSNKIPYPFKLAYSNIAASEYYIITHLKKVLKNTMI